MSSSFKFEQIDNNNKVELVFSGNIDEDTTFEEIVVSDKDEVIFNFDKIEMINSCGIRNWIEFQNRIDKKIKITYTKCPQVIIEQVNVVKGFIREGGIVESFYAPYYDDEKDEEIKVLITPSEVVDLKAPVKLNENGKELEFDDIELQYFNFLKK